MPQKEIVIVGGGASGLMAAIAAATSGARVTVLEANDRPGKKLLASGNGKCNLTNLHQTPDCYRGTDPAFLWNVIQQFPAYRTIAFFTELGLQVKNRDGWVYPVTEQSESVLKVLLMEAEHLGVRIKTREHVVSVARTKPGLEVRTRTWQYSAEAVILACGSPASAVKGSSDAALEIAAGIGQPVRPFMPALVPLNVRGDCTAKWAGVRVDAAVSLLVDGCQVMREEGNVQLAQYGISGIPVFQISSRAVREIRERGADVSVVVDFVPRYERDELVTRLHDQSKRHPWKSVRQLLTGVLPEQLIPVLVKRDASIEEAAERIRRFPLRVTDAAPGRYAQVSSGGILTASIGSDMQSRIVPGLFFAGEAVDADGACGGYNLQWAWSSGYVAGTGAAAYVK